MIVAFAILTILAAAILNRAAGSDLYGLSLLGKPLLYVAPLIGVLGYLWSPAEGALPAGSLWPVQAIFSAFGMPQPAPLPAALATGILWALAFFWWRLWPWGRWLYMDRQPIGYGRVDPPDWLERAIESISLGKARLAMFWRMQFGVLLPAIIFATTHEVEKIIVWLCFGGCLWLAYELGWLVSEQRPIPIAEYISGALWGALIVGAATWTS